MPRKFQNNRQTFKKRAKRISRMALLKEKILARTEKSVEEKIRIMLNFLSGRFYQKVGSISLSKREGEKKKKLQKKKWFQ